MLNRLRSRLSAPLVISMLALFAALGGVAAALPGKNTVNSGDVKKNSLKGVDIKESTLNIPSAAVAKDTFGVTATSTGAVTRTTLEGTSVAAPGGGAYTVTFPRNVNSCIPTASDDSVPIAVVRAHMPGGVGQENQVFITFGDSGQSAFNLSVTC